MIKTVCDKATASRLAPTRRFEFVGVRGSYCKRWEAAPLNRCAIYGDIITDPNCVRIWSRPRQPHPAKKTNGRFYPAVLVLFKYFL